MELAIDGALACMLPTLVRLVALLELAWAMVVHGCNAA